MKDCLFYRGQDRNNNRIKDLEYGTAEIEGANCGAVDNPGGVFSASLTPAEMESSASAAGQGGIAQSPASVDRIVVAVCFFVPCLMPWLSMTLMDVA